MNFSTSQDGYAAIEKRIANTTTSCFAPGRAALERLLTSIEKHDEVHVLEAIKRFNEADRMISDGSTAVGNRCLELANILYRNHEKTGDGQLMDEGIKLHRQSLALCPPEHPDRAKFCRKLAYALETYYQSSGNSDHLKEAADLQRQSLSLCPPGHPDRGLLCETVCSSLGSYYESTGDDDLLVESINNARESLAFYPPGQVNRAFCCVDLAFQLMKQYTMTGDDDVLQEAIDLQRESIFLYSPGHSFRATSCGNLANALLTQYESNGKVDLLIEAIELHRESLSLRPPGYSDRANACTDLAHSLWTYYKCTSNHKLLIEAIDLQRESLSLRPVGHPDRARSCGNLANSLRTYFQNTDDYYLLDDIYAICHEASSVYWPSTRWRCLSPLVWLHLQPNSQFFNVSTAIDYLFQIFEYHPDNISTAIMSNMSNIEQIWTVTSVMCTEHYTALFPVYLRLIRLLPFLINPALKIKSQLQALRSCSRVGSETFVSAVLAGQWQSGLEELEVVQGMLWSQLLHYRDPQLNDVPAELADRLESYIRAFGMGDTDTNLTALIPRDIQHHHVTRVHGVLQEIRSLPGLERLMLGEKFEELRLVASAHPVVVLVGAHGHYYAILLGSKWSDCTLMTLPLSDNDFGAMSSVELVSRSHRGAMASSEELPEPNDIRGLMRKTSLLSRRLRYLWSHIVKPVLGRLAIRPSKGHARPRLHWCPTGTFASLPFHAAGIYDGPTPLRECCADYVVSSYAPTITTLLRAQRAVSPIQRDSINIALIAEKQARESQLSVIHQVDTEVDSIAAVASLCHIRAVHRLPGESTISNACNAMQAANIAHIACHGIQDGKNALQSGFCLRDGRLTISKLMNLKLDNGFLAFLSACETAQGDRIQPDQVVHLAAAMMFTGFKMVIATMWGICDDDGPKVAKWFYEELFSYEAIDGDTVAHALDMAVKNLRESGVSLDRWAPFIHVGA